MLCLSYYLLCFLFNKIRAQEGRKSSARKGGSRRCWEEGEVNENMYTHVSKCNSDKIKERKKKQIVGKVTLDKYVPDVLHSVSSGWSQKSLVEISGVWHPEQRTGWRQRDCKAEPKLY
jgi:hypothetical protein